MTENQIKAAISSHFVQLIACRQGFKCSGPSEPYPDHGVDLMVTRAIAQTVNGKTRYLNNGQFVELQLKCTVESRIIRTAGDIKYDLESKTYNDLVLRRNSGSFVPLVLVVLILPDDSAMWLSVGADELVVRRSAFWYIPPLGAIATPNQNTIRIDIPAANAVGLSFIDERFQEAYR